MYRGNERVRNDQYGWPGTTSAPSMSTAHSDLETHQQGGDGDDESDELRDLDIAHCKCLRGPVCVGSVPSRGGYVRSWRPVDRAIHLSGRRGRRELLKHRHK